MTVETQETQEIQEPQEPQETQELQEIEATLELEEVEVDLTEKQENEQAEEEVPSILRTRRDGCWEVYESAWGSYLRQTDDPDANAVIDEENLKVFELKEGIHKIPAELWTRWAKLCFHFCDKVKSSVEVSIRIMRSESDPSQYRILVPKQSVSGASVRANNFDNSIDIVTGEELTQYPPSGWIPVGSSHSHNTMPAFFSSVDDKYELDDPGIHLVVGSVDCTKMKYTIAASVVGSHRRFEMHYNNLVDATWIPDLTFHEKVLEYVSTEPETTVVSTTSGVKTISSYSSYGKKKPVYGPSRDDNDYSDWWRSQGYWGDGYGQDHYNDPFYWSDSNSALPQEAVPTRKQIEDALFDYIQQNSNNFQKMVKLRDSLEYFIASI